MAWKHECKPESVIIHLSTPTFIKKKWNKEEVICRLVNKDSDIQSACVSEGRGASGAGNYKLYFHKGLTHLYKR